MSGSFVKVSDRGYGLLSRCGRFQDVLMLECRIGWYAEQTKRGCLKCLRSSNYIKKIANECYND